MTGPAGFVRPQVVPFGDSAFLVVVGDQIGLAVSARARGLAIAAGELPRSGGWGTPVIGHASVLVPYDPALLDEGDARARLEALVAAESAFGAPEPADGRLIELRVRYGGPDGPDLDEVAARIGRTPAEVVALHAGPIYRVLVLGFAPGFAYLGSVDPALRLPRRTAPRPRVPSGSVAIAGEQTAVYPLETPGGWHIIGRTDERLWDIRHEPPSLLRPGDRVRFVAET